MTGRKQEADRVRCIGHELGKVPAPGDDVYGELTYPANNQQLVVSSDRV